MELTPSPELPPESEWHFVQDLQTPLWGEMGWQARDPESTEVSLAGGARVVPRFPDPAGVLDTAYADLAHFLSAADIATADTFTVSTERVVMPTPESWRLEVTASGCRILAGDTEGIRRAIFYLEDEMRRREGPFLPLGTLAREPFIRTRISRCFFGPVKRPPRNRDELTDDVDYYPDEYLNRLAHEGINALWLTAHFRDLCPSRFFPEHGQDRERRLAKLRRTVAQCARYGIKIYVFTIEPMGFGESLTHALPLDSLERNPVLGGHRSGRSSYFCTSTEEGLEYLRDCTRFLFSSVPGLGGLIDINLGERATHCYSAIGNFTGCNCPRCSEREPWEVFRDTVSALAAGMHDVDPDTEMVSWLYVPQLSDNGGASMAETKAYLRDIAAHMPEDVTFQYNFESGGLTEQLGRQRIALDYFLSWAGPSDIYADCARNAVDSGTRASAKIQVGCSHEVATIPFIPVPGLLYEKYKAMRDIGVSTVMQCWYFGNYPGLMNKAAGELSFEPFPSDRDTFLLDLARTDWGEHAALVAEAWKLFQESYSNFPINLTFTHYGPLHHAVVWPLYLFPVDHPIAPSWKFTFPLESGDRIGECVCFDHTLAEALILLERMARLWDEGVTIFEKIEGCFAADAGRMLDIGLAKALGVQIRSAFNTFRFYALREDLPYGDALAQRAALAAMREIVRDEIENCARLSALCARDSRLGFHSEAEGYKYFPAKLDWRAGLLEGLLSVDFPTLSAQIERGEPLFPEYTGDSPEGPVYRCPRDRGSASRQKLDGIETAWLAFHDPDAVTFEIECSTPVAGTQAPGDQVILEIEPCRLWPTMRFIVSRNGTTDLQNRRAFRDDRWSASITEGGSGWTATIRIPWDCFEGYHQTGRPLRLNVVRSAPGVGGAAWLAKHPLEGRLHFGVDNPADLGWLILE